MPGIWPIHLTDGAFTSQRMTVLTRARRTQNSSGSVPTCSGPHRIVVRDSAITPGWPGKQEVIDRATASTGHLGGTWRTAFTVRRSELARWVEHEPLTGHSELAGELSTAVAIQRRRELETTRPQAYISAL